MSVHAERNAGVRSVLTVCMVLLATSAATRAHAAESLWNMEAIGRWMWGYDLADRGAGGTGVGVVDPFATSFVNPAAIAWAKMPQARIGLVTQSRWIETAEPDASDRRGSTRLSGLRAVLPGPGDLRVAFGYHDLTDGGYRIDTTVNAGRPDAYTRTIDATGALGELSATLAWPFANDRIAVGLQAGYTNGTLEEAVEVDFDDGAFVDASFLLRTRLGNRWTFGAGFQAEVLPRLSVGASWAAGPTLELRSLWTNPAGPSMETRADLDVPPGYNLGLAYALTPRNRIAVDINLRTWSGSDFDAASVDPAETGRGFRLQDGRRLAAGYTRLPSPDAQARDPILHRTIWRFGVSREELYMLQADGAGITEWVLAGGAGLPIQYDRGYVNLLLEVARTGNLEDTRLRETSLRFGVGFTFGEFQSSF